jgi:hypothetical protein
MLTATATEASSKAPGKPHCGLLIFSGDQADHHGRPSHPRRPELDERRDPDYFDPLLTAYEEGYLFLVLILARASNTAVVHLTSQPVRRRPLASSA